MSAVLYFNRETGKDNEKQGGEYDMSGLSTLEKAALLLVVIGAINWGLVGLFSLDLVALIFGSVPVLARLVYILVGLAGVYVAAAPFMGKKTATAM